MTRAVYNGLEVGCTFEHEMRSYAIDAALKDLAYQLMRGHTLRPSYTIGGELFAVEMVTGLVEDDATDNWSAITDKTNAPRGGDPTLVILPPTKGAYRYSNKVPISQHTYIGGYGALVKPRAAPGRSPDDLGGDAEGQGLSVLENVQWTFSSDSGMAGLAMRGHTASLTRWPERLKQNDYLAEGGKDPGGSWASRHNRSDDDAWLFAAGGSSNMFVINVDTFGSIHGVVRWHGCFETLFDNVSGYRTGSDMIHVVKGSRYNTIRGCTLRQGGDDCISWITYLTSGDAKGPQFNLAEYNKISGGRGRGIACTSSYNVIRMNDIEFTSMAPILIHTADAHAQDHAVGNQILQNTGFRSPQINTHVGQAGNNAPGVLFRTDASWDIRDTRVDGNYFATYDQYYGPPGSGAEIETEAIRIRSPGAASVSGTIGSDANNILEELNPGD